MGKMSALRYRYLSGYVLAASVAAVVMQVMPACQDVSAMGMGGGMRPAENGQVGGGPREKLLIDDNWKFTKDDPQGNTVSLLYGPRPTGRGRGNRGGAATQPDAAAAPPPPPPGIAPWVMPSMNELV